MKKLESDILDILQQDCRYSPAKIAVMLDKTEKEVADAIASMQARGVIVKYTAIVNDERLSDDIVQALIEVKVSPQKTSGFDAIAEEVYRFEEVKSCYLMSGGYDILLFVHAKSLKEVASFVYEKLATIHGVQSTATHFFLRTYKQQGFMIAKDSSDSDKPIISA